MTVASIFRIGPRTRIDPLNVTCGTRLNPEPPKVFKTTLRSRLTVLPCTGMNASAHGRRDVCFRMFATASKVRRKVDRAESKDNRAKASREISRSRRRTAQSKGDLDLFLSLRCLFLA